MTAIAGVSFVVPVLNGERLLDDVLEAQRTPDVALEVIAVDDGSTDRSAEILSRWSRERGVRVIAGPRRGAAAAVNAGIRAASHGVICQVDQDVVPQAGWLRALLDRMEADPALAAVQGLYLPERRDSIWARVMGLDLLQRYEAIPGSFSDHVCSGNTAYRAEALHAAGLFEEGLGYGYDNDLSYRLAAAGRRLGFCREARAVHRWRQDLRSYLHQQYGVGYGRLDLVARHPAHLHGDQVSGVGMILHAAAMLLALVCLTAAMALWCMQGFWSGPLVAAGGILGVLLVERAVSGISAARRFRDPAALAFPVAHLLRDVGWAGAILAWTGRRLARRPSRPSDSMLPSFR